MNTIRTPRALLFSPFTYIAGAQSLGLGLAAILVAGFIGSWSNTHFDGVLDLHTGAPAPLWAFLVEGFIDWLSLSVVLLILGRIISRTSFRTIDLLGTQALARWPTILMSLIVLPPGFQRFLNQIVEQSQSGKFQLNVGDMVIFSVVILALFVLLVWMVALMYRSFSVSCNVRGGKAVAVFIVGLLLAEVLSKLCLGLIFKDIASKSS